MISTVPVIFAYILMSYLHSSYSFLTSALGEVSGQRHVLDAEATRKVLSPCQGLNPGLPVHSQTLY
jgi:hypothetical protein